MNIPRPFDLEQLDGWKLWVGDSNGLSEGRSPLTVSWVKRGQTFVRQSLSEVEPNSIRLDDRSIEDERDRYTRGIVHLIKRMTESQAIEAVYENGIFRPIHPVTGLVEHSKVTLAIKYEAQAVHPLAKFAGILSDDEAEEVQTIVAEEFGTVDASGW